jgi:glycosyltransferase involved in cell wall biosynthesis
MSETTARVGVGIPTFNRVTMLQRAVRSVLAQTCEDMEIVISDNASTDGTAEFCTELAAGDPRVRYVRQPANAGLTANINQVFRLTRAPYVMMLADDDWLVPEYVARCLEVLESHPDHALVSGSPRFFVGSDFVHAGAEFDLLAESARERVRDYLGQVADNAFMYGLMRRSALEPALPMRNLLGGDWLLISAVVFAGKARMLRDVALNRSAEGTSADLRQYVDSMGLMRAQARHPRLALAVFALADIGWRSPVYRELGASGRLALARSAAGAYIRGKGKDILWDAIWPFLARRRVARVYQPLRDWSRARGDDRRA